MAALDAYSDPAALDFVMSMLGAVPIGFLLACFLGLLAFGASRLLRLVYRLVSS